MNDLELPTPEAIEQMPQHRVKMCREDLRVRLGKLTEIELELRRSIESSENGDEEALRTIEEKQVAIKALARLCTERLVNTAANGPNASGKESGMGRGRKLIKDAESADGEAADEDVEEPIKGQELKQLGVRFRDD